MYGQRAGQEVRVCVLGEAHGQQRQDGGACALLRCSCSSEAAARCTGIICDAWVWIRLHVRSVSEDGSYSKRTAWARRCMTLEWCVALSHVLDELLSLLSFMPTRFAPVCGLLLTQRRTPQISALDMTCEAVVTKMAYLLSLNVPTPRNPPCPQLHCFEFEPLFPFFRSPPQLLSSTLLPPSARSSPPATSAPRSRRRCAVN